MKRHIPNILTLLNLLSGCMALLQIMQGEPVNASWWILLAAVFDLLDGLMARLLNAASETGRQLDSLADVVSFGLAPGFLLYALMARAAIGMGPFYVNYLPYAAFLLPLFAALRLARFNTDPSQSRDFKGLPTPAAALVVLALPLIAACEDVTIIWLNSLLGKPCLLAGVAVFLSALMVSPIRMFSLKFTGLRWNGNRARYLLIIFSLLLFPFIRFAAIPFILLAYLLLSLLKPDGKLGP